MSQLSVIPCRALEKVSVGGFSWVSFCLMYSHGLSLKMGNIRADLS